jgi:hypothetical protein
MSVRPSAVSLKPSSINSTPTSSFALGSSSFQVSRRILDTPSTPASGFSLVCGPSGGVAAISPTGQVATEVVKPSYTSASLLDEARNLWGMVR